MVIQSPSHMLHHLFNFISKNTCLFSLRFLSLLLWTPLQGHLDASTLLLPLFPHSGVLFACLFSWGTFFQTILISNLGRLYTSFFQVITDLVIAHILLYYVFFIFNGAWMTGQWTTGRCKLIKYLLHWNN